MKKQKLLVVVLALAMVLCFSLGASAADNYTKGIDLAGAYGTPDSMPEGMTLISYNQGIGFLDTNNQKIVGAIATNGEIDPSMYSILIMKDVDLKIADSYGIILPAYTIVLLQGENNITFRPTKPTKSAKGICPALAAYGFDSDLDVEEYEERNPGIIFADNKSKANPDGGILNIEIEESPFSNVGILADIVALVSGEINVEAGDITAQSYTSGIASIIGDIESGDIDELYKGMVMSVGILDEIFINVGGDVDAAGGDIDAANGDSELMYDSLGIASVGGPLNEMLMYLYSDEDTGSTSGIGLSNLGSGLFATLGGSVYAMGGNVDGAAAYTGSYGIFSDYCIDAAFNPQFMVKAVGVVLAAGIAIISEIDNIIDDSEDYGIPPISEPDIKAILELADINQALAADPGYILAFGGDAQDDSHGIYAPLNLFINADILACGYEAECSDGLNNLIYLQLLSDVMVACGPEDDGCGMYNGLVAGFISGDFYSLGDVVVDGGVALCADTMAILNDDIAPILEEEIGIELGLGNYDFGIGVSDITVEGDFKVTKPGEDSLMKAILSEINGDSDSSNPILDTFFYKLYMNGGTIRAKGAITAENGFVVQTPIFPAVEGLIEGLYEDEDEEDVEDEEAEDITYAAIINGKAAGKAVSSSKELEGITSVQAAKEGNPVVMTFVAVLVPEYLDEAVYGQPLTTEAKVANLEKPIKNYKVRVVVSTYDLDLDEYVELAEAEKQLNYGDENGFTLDIPTVDKDGNPLPCGFYYVDYELIDITDGSVVSATDDYFTIHLESRIDEYLNCPAEGFIVGDKGKVFADSNLTRAQAAQMLYNLLIEDTWLLDEVDNPPVFSDVNKGDWYYDAVTTLTSFGIIAGRTATTFDPNADITRAEFCALLARMAEEPAAYKAMTFTDVKGHWAEKNIALAYTYGWIAGYPNNTFRPNNNITRAEAITMILNATERVVDDEYKDYVDENIDDLVTFSDLTGNEWYYYYVMAAAN